MRNKYNAKFISIWNGGYMVETFCCFDLETMTVFNVQQTDENIEDLDILDTQYVLFEGKEYDTFYNDDDGCHYENGQNIEY